MRCLKLLLINLLFSTFGWSHNPILIDTAISITGDDVDLVLDIKQAEILFAQHQNRSLFRDRSDFEALQSQIGTWLVGGTSVTIDGVEIPLSYAGIHDHGELSDPLSFHLHGQVKNPKRIVVRISLFQNLGSGYSIIDNIHLISGSHQAATVKPGEDVCFDVDSQVQTSTTVGSFTSFLRLGFLHIVPEGLDHILFVLGLFLLSPRLKPLLTQVTAFTIAHSLTLGLSLAGLVTLPSRIVEPLIAVSIAAVALENIYSREVKTWRWMIVFAFGLVHGLGFAGALKDLHLPKGTILKPLIGFNCGVELGQLTVIGAAACLTWWCWTKPWYRQVVVVPASVLIAAIGLFWAIERSLGYGISP